MSERTKACMISKKTKSIVYDRDKHCCIFCGSPYAMPEAHFIPRSLGGLGVPENILTVCRPCHDKFDRGTREERDEMREYARDYLKAHYPDWDEDSLYYKNRREF